MRSNRKLKFAAIAFLISGATACGMFGQKAPKSRLMELAAAKSGCMNSFGEQAWKFMDGDVSPEEWKQTWDCATSALVTFRNFVSGSDSAGYTADDLHAFASAILVTDRVISKELIRATLEFKASVFGGTAAVLRYDEIQKVVKIFQAVQKESLRLIPFLKVRPRNPSSANLLELSQEIQKSISAIGESVESLGSTHPLTKDVALILHDQLIRLFNWNVSSRWVPVGFALKAILVGGSDQLVEGSAWRDLLDLTSRVGAPLFALISSDSKRMLLPNEYGRFIAGLTRQFSDALTHAMARHGGAIPLAKLDTVLDALPEGVLGSIGIPGLKKNLRPFFRKLLQAQTDEVIDSSVIDTILSLMNRWSDGKTHLESIYARSSSGSEGLSAQEFTTLAQDYERDLDPIQQESVRRLIKLMTDYKPLFANNDSEVTMTPMAVYSLSNMSKMHWMEILMTHLIRSYSSHANKDRLTLPEVQRVVLDYVETGISGKFIDPTVPGYFYPDGRPQEDAGFSNRRFRDGDLFQLNSDGDGTVSIAEGPYLLAFLTSTTSLSSRVREAIEPICKSEEKDDFGWYWMDAECFRREFFARSEIFFSRFPGLLKHIRTLSPRDFEKLQHAMLNAGRLYGDVPRFPIASYDVSGTMGLVLVVENLFSRFDGNTNGTMGVTESLNAAKIFRRVIKEKEPMSNSSADAVFTYLLKYKRLPKSILQKAQFLLWKIGRPFWSLSVNRSDVYDVAAIITPPAPITP